MITVGSVPGDMSENEGASSGADADAQTPDNPLFDLYRTYIGEPDAQTDVYLGFGLFFSGILIGVVALGSFVWAGTFEARTTPYFARVLPAYTLGMLSLPTALVGIVVLLPVKARALLGSLAGTAVTVLAVGGFIFAYPDNWNGYGADYTIPIVAAYAVGLTAVVATTGAALVAHQIERAKPADVDVEKLERRRDEDEGEDWTEEEIQRDIEEAMAETEISWGGVEKREGTRLNLNTDIGGDVDLSGVEVDPDTDRSTGVDAQVEGLRQLKGDPEEKTTTAQGSTVDDQTAALTELKEMKREGKTPNDADGTGKEKTDTGLFGRLKGFFS
jgi:hypothetical protein